jgi:hypothetical protein
MFNVLRNNIAKISNNRQKLYIINNLTKNFIVNNTSQLNYHSKFSFMTYNNINNNNLQSIREENKFSKLKLNKIISKNFFGRFKRNAKPEPKRKKDNSQMKPIIVDKNPEFYNVLIEEVSKSPNLNEEEKSALIEKLRKFLNVHIEVNNERKNQDFQEVYQNIVEKLNKEEKQKYREQYENAVYVFNYSKFLFLFFKKYFFRI